ncbi:MAG: hypothetical protein GF418_05300 [Chitinivibrionales bacterium]|nr:hypothetical protein [Chitinivibrionales bacterium]MBD3395027.1 hypothetical protein [Chitinivibrionales bacterium]
MIVKRTIVLPLLFCALLLAVISMPRCDSMSNPSPVSANGSAAQADTAAPGITVEVIPDTLTILGEDSLIWIPAMDSLFLRGTLADSSLPFSSLTLTVGDSAYVLSPDTAWAARVAFTWTDDTRWRALEVVATDRAGNTGRERFFIRRDTLFYDSVPPAIGVVEPIGTIMSRSLTLKLSVTDYHSGVFAVTVDGYQAAQRDDSTWTKSLSFPALAHLGDTSVTIVAYDKSRLRNSDTLTAVFVYDSIGDGTIDTMPADTVPPVIAVLVPAEDSLEVLAESLEVSVRVVDSNGAVTRVQVNDRNLEQSASDSLWTGIVYMDTTHGSVLVSFRLRFTAEDTAGNIDTVYRHVLYRDTGSSADSGDIQAVTSYGTCMDYFKVYRPQNWVFNCGIYDTAPFQETAVRYNLSYEPPGHRRTYAYRNESFWDLTDSLLDTLLSVGIEVYEPGTIGLGTSNTAEGWVKAVVDSLDSAASKYGKANVRMLDSSTYESLGYYAKERMFLINLLLEGADEVKTHTSLVRVASNETYGYIFVAEEPDSQTLSAYLPAYRAVIDGIVIPASDGAYSTDTHLWDLGVRIGDESTDTEALVPDFNPLMTSYLIFTDAAQIRFRPDLISNPSAAVRVAGGAGLGDGELSDPVALTGDTTDIAVEVTAPDGDATKEYSIRVVRP